MTWLFILGDMTKILGNMTKILGDMNKILGKMTKILSNVTKILGNMIKILGNMTQPLGDMTSRWLDRFIQTTLLAASRNSNQGKLQRRMSHLAWVQTLP